MESWIIKVIKMYLLGTLTLYHLKVTFESLF